MRANAKSTKIKSIKTILCACLIITTILLSGCGVQTASVEEDTVKFQGHKYAPLDYPVNIFYYDYNGNSHDNFEEVDGRYEIDSPNWDMIWNAGDLYCITKHVDEANKYYANDENYVWYALIDSDEEDNEINSYPIEITAEELQAVYAVENQERDLALYFEDFEKTGSLFKISEDGVVRGTISVVKYQGQWYWNSEVIDESQERDDTWPEYVQPLPDSLSKQICEAE